MGFARFAADAKTTTEQLPPPWRRDGVGFACFATDAKTTAERLPLPVGEG